MIELDLVFLLKPNMKHLLFPAEDLLSLAVHPACYVVAFKGALGCVLSVAIFFEICLYFLERRRGESGFSLRLLFPIVIVIAIAIAIAIAITVR